MFNRQGCSFGMLEVLNLRLLLPLHFPHAVYCARERRCWVCVCLVCVCVCVLTMCLLCAYCVLTVCLLCARERAKECILYVFRKTTLNHLLPLPLYLGFDVVDKRAEAPEVIEHQAILALGVVRVVEVVGVVDKSDRSD